MDTPPQNLALATGILALACVTLAPDVDAFALDESGATQAVVVVTDGWKTPTAQLSLIEKTSEGGWKAIRTGPAVVGRNGLGWGSGLHAAPANGAHPTKKEGDGKAPAGIFALGDRAFGKSKATPRPTAFRWIPAADNVCVDDVNSPHYNHIVPAPSIKGQYRSAERMRRKDALYDVVLVVDHNAGANASTVGAATEKKLAPKAGRGSCIFLHVWRRANKGTAGCTAMPKKTALNLLETLDPQRHPVLIQLPRREYEQRAAEWGLPPLAQIGL